MQRVEDDQRHRVVVLWITLAQIPVNLFVDKVEPEKAVVANCGQHHPRQGQNQEDCNALDQAQASNLANAAGRHQKQQDDSGGENDSDQTLCQEGKRAAYVDPEVLGGPPILACKAAYEKVKGNGNQSCEQNVRDQNPSE